MEGSQVQTKAENGYYMFYDPATGRIVDVMTAGPKIIDHFYTNSQLRWNSAVVNGSTQTYAGGICTVTTGAADNDDHDMTSDLMFDPSKGLTCEARLALGDADQTAFNIGFSDALTEAADQIAVTFHTATATSNATNCALMFSDSDATTDRVRALAVNADTDGTVITASSAPLVDNAYHVYRVEIDPAGNVKFYYDGVLAGTETLGIAAGATLCAYFALINRESATNTAALDYFHAWQWNA